MALHVSHNGLRGDMNFMDFSLLHRLPKSEMNDDEVTQILKKWSSNNPPPRKVASLSSHNETFDSRTYTRPKRKTLNMSDAAESDLQSVESGVSLEKEKRKASTEFRLFLDFFNKSSSWRTVVVTSCFIIHAAKLAERRLTAQLHLHLDGLPELRQSNAEQSDHQQRFHQR